MVTLKGVVPRNSRERPHANTETYGMPSVCLQPLYPDQHAHHAALDQHNVTETKAGSDIFDVATLPLFQSIWNVHRVLKRSLAWIFTPLCVPKGGVRVRWRWGFRINLGLLKVKGGRCLWFWRLLSLSPIRFFCPQLSHWLCRTMDSVLLRTASL